MNAGRNDRWFQLLLYVLASAGSVALFAGHRAVLRCALTGAGWLIGYPAWARGPAGVWTAVLGLLAAWFFLRRWMAFLRREAGPASKRWLETCAPLSWLPLLTALRMLAILPGIAGTIGSNALFFGVPLVAALCLEGWIGEFRSSAGMAAGAGRSERRWIEAVFVLLWVFYFALGVRINSKIGEKMGDEAHYLTMANSLFQDGDIEVSNNLPEPLPADPAMRKRLMPHYHTKEAAHGVYSYQAFGLPLLAFPFNQWGLVGRQFFLALIGAGSALGVYVLCRRFGAGIRASASVCALLALGFSWAFYAIRYLPEMLGCGLAAWAFWAVWAQRSRPVAATIVAAGCCLYLPVAHERFATPSILLATAFCVEALLSRGESWRRRLGRVFSFGVPYAAGGVALLLCTVYMYGTICAYNPGRLMSHPAFMWGMFIDDRQISAAFPLAYLFYAAPAILMFRPGIQKRRLGWPLLVLAGVLAATCSVYIHGGACAPGRYLLITLPVFAPLAALALEDARRGARIWFWFLGLLAVFTLPIAVTHLQKGYFVPLVALSVRKILLHPLEPIPLVSVSVPPFAGALALATIAAILLFAVTFLLFAPPFRLRKFLAGGCGAAVVLIAAVIQQNAENGGETVDLFCGRVRPSNYRWLRTPASDVPAPLLDVFRRPFMENKFPIWVTTLSEEQMPEDAEDRIVSIRGMGPDDWKSRGWYWHLLQSPLTLQDPGKLLFRISGEVSGDAELVFAFRHGPYTLDEGTVRRKSEAFDLAFVLPLGKNRGDLLPLVRFEGGDGTLRIDNIQCAAYNDQMFAEARFECGGGERILIDPANARHEP